MAVHAVQAAFVGRGLRDPPAGGVAPVAAGRPAGASAKEGFAPLFGKAALPPERVSQSSDGPTPALVVDLSVVGRGFHAPPTSGWAGAVFKLLPTQLLLSSNRNEIRPGGLAASHL